MIRIIINEWQGWWRSGQLRWLISFLLMLLVIITFFGVQDVNKRQDRVEHSKEEVRDQWENMGPANPHGAAHYGSFAFKPVSPLTALDEGVNLAAGSVLRLEGHRQNEVVHSSQSQSSFISYFGPLKPSLILQIILPLLFIFLTFYSIRSEQEQGRLKILLAQGASYFKLIMGKVLSVWLLSVLVLLIILAVQWISFINGVNNDLIARSGLLILAYGSFYWIIIALTASVSYLQSRNSSALTIMLTIWVIWLIFLPKLSGWYVQEKHELPSRQEFKSAMREDRSKGIDGHNPSDEREKALKDSILAEYNVTTLDSLPINYDGIVMQADEEYGNKVWDKHFGALFELLQTQKASMQYFGIINPFSSLQSLSMGVCGTDQWNHLHFQRDAESYRRVFIKALNDEHAYGGSKSGDWGWKADQEFFNSIEDFHYEIPEYSMAAGIYYPDWIFLGTWVMISIISMLYVNARFKKALV